jgi:peptidoglycan/xylan/chitin deacetylase (PgdA/CDA1 family)
MNYTRIMKNACRFFFPKFFPKKNCILIIIYHNVQNFKQFEKQLIFFQKKFEIISIDDAVALLSGNVDFEPKLVLTFDDGYKNVYDLIRNIIKQIPVCIYLTTKNIESEDFFWWDIFRIMAKKNDVIANNLYSIEKLLKTIPQEKREKTIEELKGQLNFSKNDYFYQVNFSPLSWENIKNLKEFNVNFQAHGHNHFVMIHTSIKTLNDDIQINRVLIQKNTNAPCIHFAYPGGFLNDEIITLVKDSKFVSAVTIDYGINTKDTSLFELKRIGIRDNDSLLRVTLKLYGFWIFYSNIDRMKKRLRGGLSENRLDK